MGNKNSGRRTNEQIAADLQREQERVSLSRARRKAKREAIAARVGFSPVKYEEKVDWRTKPELNYEDYPTHVFRGGSFIDISEHNKKVLCFGGPRL